MFKAFQPRPFLSVSQRWAVKLLAMARANPHVHQQHSRPVINHGRQPPLNMLASLEMSAIGTIRINGLAIQCLLPLTSNLASLVADIGRGRPIRERVDALRGFYGLLAVAAGHLYSSIKLRLGRGD